MCEPEAAPNQDLLPRWQVRSPPALVGSLATYAMMFLPAIMGLVWDWPWLITLALMSPGMLAHEILGFRAAGTRRIRSRRELSSDKRLTALLVVIAVIAGLTISGVAKRAVPIDLAVVLLLVVEPIWRLQWRRHDARTGREA